MSRLTFSPSQISVELPDQIVEMAKEHGSRLMDHDQLSYLAASLALSPWTKNEIVVEIGTYVGSTAAFLARTLRALGREGCPVLSIDPFERLEQEDLNAQGSYQKYLETVKQHGVEDVCLPLAALSEHAAPVVPDRAGVLIVDGSHRYPGVIKDLQLYAPKVVPGGAIFMDDYTPAYAGVRQAIDEYFSADKPWALLHKSYFVVMQRKP